MTVHSISFSSSFGAGNCVKRTDEYLLDTIQSNVYNRSYRYSRVQGHCDCFRSVFCDSTSAEAITAFHRTVRTAPLRSARKRCIAGPYQLRQLLDPNDSRVAVPACASFLASPRNAAQECSTAHSTSASNWLADVLPPWSTRRRRSTWSPQCQISRWGTWPENRHPLSKLASTWQCSLHRGP